MVPQSKLTTTSRTGWILDYHATKTEVSNGLVDDWLLYLWLSHVSVYKGVSLPHPTHYPLPTSPYSYPTHIWLIISHCSQPTCLMIHVGRMSLCQ